MPCQCYYGEPSKRCRESKLVAGFLADMYRKRKEEIPEFIKNAYLFNDISSLDQNTYSLCSIMRMIDKNNLSVTDFFSKNVEERLIKWWKKHKALDKIREILTHEEMELLEL